MSTSGLSKWTCLHEDTMLCIKCGTSMFCPNVVERPWIKLVDNTKGNIGLALHVDVGEI